MSLSCDHRKSETWVNVTITVPWTPVPCKSSKSVEPRLKESCRIDGSCRIAVVRVDIIITSAGPLPPTLGSMLTKLILKGSFLYEHADKAMTATPLPSESAKCCWRNIMWTLPKRKRSSERSFHFLADNFLPMMRNLDFSMSTGKNLQVIQGNVGSEPVPFPCALRTVRWNIAYNDIVKEFTRLHGEFEFSSHLDKGIPLFSWFQWFIWILARRTTVLKSVCQRCLFPVTTGNPRRELMLL